MKHLAIVFYKDWLIKIVIYSYYSIDISNFDLNQLYFKSNENVFSFSKENQQDDPYFQILTKMLTDDLRAQWNPFKSCSVR